MKRNSPWTGITPLPLGTVRASRQPDLATLGWWCTLASRASVAIEPESDLIEIGYCTHAVKVLVTIFFASKFHHLTVFI